MAALRAKQIGLFRDFLDHAADTADALDGDIQFAHGFDRRADSLVDLAQRKNRGPAGFASGLHQGQGLPGGSRSMCRIRGDRLDRVAHAFDGAAHLEYLGRLFLGIRSDRVRHLADSVSCLVGLVGRDMHFVQDGFEACDEIVDRPGKMADLVIVVRSQAAAQIAVVEVIDLADDMFQTFAQVATEQGFRDHGDDAQRYHWQQYYPQYLAHDPIDPLLRSEFGLPVCVTSLSSSCTIGERYMP